jgi:hypothetical protein
MQPIWETEVAQLLTDLSAAQDELFAILARKRTMLIESDHSGLATLIPEEEQLIAKMQSCASRREDLLRRAKMEGLPSKNIAALSKSLPTAGVQRPHAIVAKPKPYQLDCHSAHADSSFADVRDYRNRWTFTADIRR